MVDWNERLAEAVRAGNARRVREALSRGAKLASSSSSSSPGGASNGKASLLHVGAERGDAEVLQALLESGGKRLLGGADAQGRTPLIYAVQSGNIPAVKVLLDAGADVNAADIYGNTPLRTAAAEGTLEMVKLLVSAGADPLIPGRLTLNALDRARERRTPEGRMITVFLERPIAERPHRPPVRSGPNSRRPSKPGKPGKR